MIGRLDEFATQTAVGLAGLALPAVARFGTSLVAVLAGICDGGLKGFAQEVSGSANLCGLAGYMGVDARHLSVPRVLAARVEAGLEASERTCGLFVGLVQVFDHTADHVPDGLVRDRQLIGMPGQLRQDVTDQSRCNPRVDRSRQARCGLLDARGGILVEGRNLFAVTRVDS